MPDSPTTPPHTARGPRHVAVIMDGNGRWAAARQKPRASGHRAGAQSVRRITRAAAQMGLQQLTLYAFSSENWARPRREVDMLMRLFARYLRSEQAELAQRNIRLRMIGRLADLPAAVQRAADRAIAVTSACTGMTLCLAVNYGGRAEIVDACRRLAALATQGGITPETITEEALARRLCQPDMPPLDLIIRTAGEQRLSNFLLWQAAYAELWFTPVPWPDFTEEHLRQAISDFRRRTRRFGALPRPVPESKTILHAHQE